MGASSLFSSCFSCGKESDIVPEKSTEQTKETTSSVSKEGTRFEYREGIRYQNESEVAYLLPNNYDELDRLQQQHWLLKCLLQSNFNAPVEEGLKKGIKVLDAGCGPGTWALDMAETYKSSKFIGMDSSAVFPENIKPGNVEFAVGNLSKTLPFPDNHFDFAFQRFLILGLTKKDWENALGELYRVLKPGGYVEVVEVGSDLYNTGPLTEKLNTKMIELATLANLVPFVVLELNELLDKTGFINIDLKKKVNMNFNHTNKAGELAWEDFKVGYLNNRPVVAKMNPEWADPEAYEKYVNACGEECKANKTYGYTVHAFVAQKPFD